MTTVRFSWSQGRLVGFSCQGHSGYGNAGDDIVCAAITSAIRLAECIIDDVLLAHADVTVDDKTAEISLALPEAKQCPDSCQAVLTGLYRYMRELSQEYPDHLSVLEV